MSDGQLWRAVAGRAGGKPAANPADGLSRLLAAGVSKKEIAAQLGVSPRTVERYTTTGAQKRDPARSKYADRIVDLANNHPKVRQQAVSKYRTSRMRNKGARIRIDGEQGPRRHGRNYPRQRVIVHELDPYAMDQVLDAWSRGDDAAALDAIRQALEEEGYPSWEWSDDATMDFLGLSRD